SFKPLPICAHNQTAAAIGIALHGRIGNRAIRKVDVHLDPYLAPGMGYKGPFSRVAETLMSTAFCVSSALVRGAVDVSDLESYDDPAIMGLVPQVDIVTDEAIPFPACRMVVTMADGEIIAHEDLRKVSDFDLDWSQIGSLLRAIAAANDVGSDGLRSEGRRVGNEHE